MHFQTVRILHKKTAVWLLHLLLQCKQDFIQAIYPFKAAQSPNLGVSLYSLLQSTGKTKQRNPRTKESSHLRSESPLLCHGWRAERASSCLYSVSRHQFSTKLRYTTYTDSGSLAKGKGYTSVFLEETRFISTWTTISLEERSVLTTVGYCKLVCPLRVLPPESSQGGWVFWVLSMEGSWVFGHWARMQQRNLSIKSVTLKSTENRNDECWVQ